MIEIRGCSKAFGTLMAVSKVSMEIGEREVFGLVGSNGAGKSTLLRMIAGILKPDEGEIKIDDMAVFDNEKAKEQIGNLNMNVRRTVTAMHTPNMRSVINGTGTILHTNLGRAPISQKHMNRIAQIATGYSNLEYNLEAGRRGERYSHFEKLLCKITGAEAAMAVNNNAAAVMLILSSLAKEAKSLYPAVSLLKSVENSGFRMLWNKVEQHW